MKNKAPDFRVCPACAARNKAKWEYCVKCGEALQDVPLGEPPPVARVDEEATVDPEPAGISGMLFGLVGLAAMGAAIFFLLRPPPPSPQVDPGAFVMPTVPPAPAAVVVASPEDEDVHQLYVAGRERLARKDYPGAIERLSKAVDKHGDRAEYRLAYGKALWGAGSLDQAEVQLETAARLRPSAPNLVELARLREAAGRGPGAIDAYESAIAADSRSLDALKGLAGAHIRAGRHAVAIPILRRAAAQQPNDPMIAQELGAALDKTNDLPGAAAAYEQVLRIEPRGQVPRGQLAEVLFRQGKADEAVQVFRDGIANDPGAPLLHRGLGSLLERTGKAAEAVAEYREYARLAPNAPDARAMAERAQAIEQQGPSAQSSASPAPQS